MGLDPGDRRVRAAARRAFRNYAKYLVDMMRIGELSPDGGGQTSSTSRTSRFSTRRTRDGKGVLVCTIHVGGMDLIGPGLKLRGESMHVVADDTTYGRLFDHLSAARARQDIFVIGWRNLRGLFRVLRENGNLVLFCDGGYRRGDVPVEFCGEATTFPIGPATLAAKTGAPLLPVWCRRDRGRALRRARAAVRDLREHRAGRDLSRDAGGRRRAGPGDRRGPRAVVHVPAGLATDRCGSRAARGRPSTAARRGEDWTKIGA